MIHIVTLGDSVTLGVRNGNPEEEEYYSLMLETKLLSAGFPVEVIPRGIGGESTSGGLARLNDIIALQPDYVTIMYGLNDAFMEKDAEEPQVSISQYGMNLMHMVHRFREAGARVVLMTPNPQSPYGSYTEERIARRPYSTYGDMNYMLKHHVEEMKRIGKNECVPVLDIYSKLIAIGVQDDASMTYLRDGVHPTQATHRIITEIMVGYFLKELQDRQPALPTIPSDASKKQEGVWPPKR